MSVGRIPEFRVATDNWTLYVERLEQYFIVNEIADELKVPTLITVIGAECYELLVNLCTPVKPKDKTFAEITEILEKHLLPRPSELAERYKFRHRKQGERESIAEYVAVLKSMSKTCAFGSWLEESLRDQLVCGINSDTIRQGLFAEDGLDFGKAYRLAVSMESAERDAAVVDGRAASSGGAGTAECQAMSAATGRRPGAFMASRGDRGSSSKRGERGVWRGRAGAPPPGPAASQVTARCGQQCSACGGGHGRGACQFSRYVCRVCNRQGHLKRMCPYLSEQYNAEVAAENEERGTFSEDSDEVFTVNLNQLSLAKYKPIVIRLNVHGNDLDMECDTGSAVSCINDDLYVRLFKHLELMSCNLKLRYYTGEIVSPLGVIKPLVNYKDKQKYLDLYVIPKGKTMLIGRQWLFELNMQIPVATRSNVNMISETYFNRREFSSRFSDVFADGLGRFTGGQVTIHLREGARPVFLRARPLAYALREPVERALEQLVRDGVLTPVDRSDWATPIVPVVKKDGNIRICADFKLTLNRVLEVDRYPLPRVEDLLARLHGGDRFSKVDLSQAYAQFELDESKKCTVINTHKGLFRYNRLVYGLSSSPGIFQRQLEQLFADLPHVGVFLDDVIITGENTEAHVRNLYKVFERLQASGLRVKKEKCEFFAESISYLGHVISKAGVHTCPDKIKAIMNTPAPTKVSEVRAFIGMIMYYAKFVKNVSSILTPLYRLLKAGTKFNWCSECETAFDTIKRALSSCEVLVHYSSSLPLVMTADASAVGVGCVISHLTPQGERPVAYASRTLTEAERSYAQIDREALAIVYGIRKFHQYLYGRKFILRTDHKPLTYIFGDKVGIPVMAASRLQRWAVLLSGYDYQIEYVTSSKNCADALSRLPQRSTGSERVKGNDVTYLNFVENFLPITNEDVKTATKKDVLLSRIVVYVHSGWPATCSDEEVKPYFARRHELYLDRGCLMWGYRMVIPSALRDSIQKQLHVSHMGIVKTKALARSYVWWPNIDADVEALCRGCETCAGEAPAPPRGPPSPWPYYTQPWSRLHVDFLGPFKGTTFLVLIDSSTKWLEIFEMKCTNAGAVIKVLRAIFARFGLPTELVSDQGPPFTSAELKAFLERNGIRQSFSPVYHPASNGAAENAVKLCKRAIKKAYRDGVEVDAALQTYLLAYRNSTHSTTGESPAMLLQHRSLRSRLDLLRSERALEERIARSQRHQVIQAGGTPREFEAGDAVWARNYSGPEKWVKGTIKSVESTNRYLLGNGTGKPVLRHIDQIRRRSRLSTVPCPGSTNGDKDEVIGGEDDVGQTEIGRDVPSEGRKEALEERSSLANNRSQSQASSPDPNPPPPLRAPVNLRPLPNRNRFGPLEID